MQQSFKKGNRYEKLLKEFKRTLGFKSAELESLDRIVGPDDAFTVTVKYNGELAALVCQDARSSVYNSYGRVRTGFPITEVLTEICSQKKIHNLVVFGELYAVDDSEAPLPLNQVMSIIKAPKSPSDIDRIRVAVFDVYSMDGEVLFGNVPYEDRFILIYQLFKDNGTIHPVAGRSGVTGENVIQELFDRHVIRENYEGLVIRKNGAVKIKPVHSLDLAVVGVFEGTGRLTDSLGGLVCAFMAPDRTLMYACRVGTGFSDDQRDDLWRELVSQAVHPPSRVMEKKLRKPVHLVPPELVAEVEATDFLQRDVECLKWHPRKEIYTKAGELPGFVLQFPRFIRFREDKTVNPQDLRIEQVPV